MRRITVTSDGAQRITRAFVSNMTRWDTMPGDEGELRQDKSIMTSDSIMLIKKHTENPTERYANALMDNERHPRSTIMTQLAKHGASPQQLFFIGQSRTEVSKEIAIAR
jgi:hypothetical protein